MDVAGSVVRFFARSWLQRVQAELSLLPVPVGSPRQHVGGRHTDRVLVFGNGPATGFGVRTQELGLPGQLARELVRRTGRGIEVDLVRGRGFTIESAFDRLELVRVERYDAVVVTVGATDAGGLLPAHRWESALRGLVSAIRFGTASTTPILLLGIRPQATVPQGLGVFNRLVDQHAARLDTVTERVAETVPHLEYLGLEPALRGVGAVRYYSPDSYRAIADAAAAILAPALDRSHADGTWAETRNRRDRAQVEDRRQQAVDALGIASPHATERLERLVRSAADLFGTTGAAVTIIDRDRQVHKASVGLDTDELPRRLAVCDRTIQEDAALVVADVTSDPRTAGTDMRARGGPVRFYAGFPIESPDGYRLGALCVFDSEERDPTGFDVERLRDLALQIQNELWDEAARTRRP